MTVNDKIKLLQVLCDIDWKAATRLDCASIYETYQAGISSSTKNQSAEIVEEKRTEEKKKERRSA